MLPADRPATVLLLHPFIVKVREVVEVKVIILLHVPGLGNEADLLGVVDPRADLELA